MTDGNPPLNIRSAFLAPGDLHAQVERATDAARAGVPHALLAVRVERLPEVVANCGEDAETAVLGLIATTLDEQVGRHHGACRLDAAAFALVKPLCLPDEAGAIARRVRAALGGGEFGWRGRSFRLGAVVGVLELGAERTPGPVTVALALEACTAADRLGGDGVVVAAAGAAGRIALAQEETWREHLAAVI